MLLFIRTAKSNPTLHCGGKEEEHPEGAYYLYHRNQLLNLCSPGFRSRFFGVVKFIDFAVCLYRTITTSSQLDECSQHGLQPDFSLSRASLSALELDPVFVEAIKHLDARYGVLHALRFE